MTKKKPKLTAQLKQKRVTSRIKQELRDAAKPKSQMKKVKEGTSMVAVPLNVELDKNGRFPCGIMLEHHKEGIFRVCVEKLDKTHLEMRLQVVQTHFDVFGGRLNVDLFTSSLYPTEFRKVVTTDAQRVHAFYGGAKKK